MSRNKKSGCLGGVLVLIAIAATAVLLLIVTLTPIVVLALTIAGIVISSRSMRELSQNGKSIFWLSPEEQKRFAHLHATVNTAQARLSAIHTDASRKGISVNKDGQYSLRSKAGKAARAAVDENTAILASNTPEYEKIVVLPQTRWERFSLFCGLARGAGLGCLVWLAGLICFASKFGPPLGGGFREGIHRFFSFPSNLTAQPPLLDGEFAWMLGIAILTIVVTIGGSVLLGHRVASRSVTKPPMVNQQNYNKPEW